MISRPECSDANATTTFVGTVLGEGPVECTGHQDREENDFVVFIKRVERCSDGRKIETTNSFVRGEGLPRDYEGVVLEPPRGQ